MVMRSDWLWWFKENLPPRGELLGGRDHHEKYYLMDKELRLEVRLYLAFKYGKEGSCISERWC